MALMVYVGQTRSASLLAQLTKLGFGECTQPKEHPSRRDPWFLDNAAFKAFQAGKGFDSHAFVRILRRVRLWAEKGESTLPDFVVAPDVVGEASSLDFSRGWLDDCRDLGVPVYLAVQDGMEICPATVEGFDGVFVGGTLEWKLETGGAWVELAHSLGLPCHVGRVGTAARVLWAGEIGADSIDSCLPLWSQAKLDGFAAAVATVNGSAPEVTSITLPDGVSLDVDGDHVGFEGATILETVRAPARQDSRRLPVVLLLRLRWESARRNLWAQIGQGEVLRMPPPRGRRQRPARAKTEPRARGSGLPPGLPGHRRSPRF